MLSEEEGSLLDADAEALVNTVNTVGIMGKGIALQVKQAYPGNFRAYEAACRRGDVRLGAMFTYETGLLDSPRYIINFPTKGHWRAKSKLSDIAAGLADLRRVIQDRDIRSIAVPPLGCGNGGLDWRDVRPLITEVLGDLPEVNVMLYPPKGTPAAESMMVRTARPKMTAGRAALLTTLGHYVRLSQSEQAAVLKGASLLEIQKLMYFLQEAGQPLHLNYAKARYGPYAENLNHVLQALEGHYLRGVRRPDPGGAQAQPYRLSGSGFPAGRRGGNPPAVRPPRTGWQAGRARTRRTRPPGTRSAARGRRRFRSAGGAWTRAYEP